MRKQGSQSGQSLFEVVVAVGVFALIIAAIVGLATSSIRNTTFTRNNALATRYSQEAVEWLRTQRDTDWSSFHTYALGVPPTYCLSDLSWADIGDCGSGDSVPETILFRKVDFLDVTDTSVTATIETSWTDSQGTHQVEVSTEFTDWRSR